MKKFANFIDFSRNVGKLRKISRRGCVLIGSKDPAHISDHVFRVTLMAWVLGREKKGLNLKRVLEIALVHDLCELYIGGKSPYDYKTPLPKDKRKWPKIFDTWPRYSLAEKKKMTVEKKKQEGKALNRFIKGLPAKTQKRLRSNWLDYEKNASKEAKFVKQVNRLETLLQALEHGQEEKIRVYKSWWIGSREKIDDPILVKFMDSLAKQF